MSDKTLKYFDSTVIPWGYTESFPGEQGNLSPSIHIVYHLMGYLH